LTIQKEIEAIFSEYIKLIREMNEKTGIEVSLNSRPEDGLDHIVLELPTLCLAEKERIKMEGTVRLYLRTDFGSIDNWKKCYSILYSVMETIAYFKGRRLKAKEAYIDTSNNELNLFQAFVQFKE
jgi:hypothetical protein